MSADWNLFLSDLGDEAGEPKGFWRLKDAITEVEFALGSGLVNTAVITRASNAPVEARDPSRLVRRVAWVCKYCDCVYADDQVSQCDCMGATDKKPPHFIKGKIEYSQPNSELFHP